MAEPFSTFHSWVLGNFPVDESPMGTVAGDWRVDEEFPTSANSWEEIEAYLVSSGTGEQAISVARHAWSQYMAERTEFEVAELADELASA